MNTIKIKIEKVPYNEGLSLYYNGRKAHKGVFSTLKAIREFWNTYRPMICSGYVMIDFKNWSK